VEKINNFNILSPESVASLEGRLCNDFDREYSYRKDSMWKQKSILLKIKTQRYIWWDSHGQTLMKLGLDLQEKLIKELRKPLGSLILYTSTPSDQSHNCTTPTSSY